MIETILILLIIRDQLHNEENRAVRRREIERMRSLRDNNNVFSLPAVTFRKHFRMPQQIAIQLIEILEPHNESTYSTIPLYLKVLAALNFYATGSYQKPVGINNLINLSQSSISRSVCLVSKLIQDVLGPIYVKFPHTAEDINTCKTGFFEKFGINNTIGAIDCTHVVIIAPPITDILCPPRMYRNRNRLYSINVEAICDSDLKLLHINAKFPGSCHDSGIWSISPIRSHFRNNYVDNYGWLLGDSGYPLEPWLLTPFPENVNGGQHNLTEQEQKYNNLHKLARNTIERLFGVLKSVFRCLLKHRMLHYTPVKAEIIINACAILYNYLKSRNINDINEFLEEIDNDNISDNESFFNNGNSGNIFVEGTIIRQNYAQSL